MSEGVLNDLAGCFMDERGRDTVCIESAERSGFKLVGEGSNRYVFSKGDKAYKFAKHLKGLEGNKRELELFEEAPSELRAHLAAPHDSGEDDRWVEFHRYPEQGQHGKKRANELMEKYGWECWDLHSRNVIGPSGESEFVIADYESCDRGVTTP